MPDVDVKPCPGTARDPLKAHAAHRWEYTFNAGVGGYRRVNHWCLGVRLRWKQTVTGEASTYVADNAGEVGTYRIRRYGTNLLGSTIYWLCEFAPGTSAYFEEFTWGITREIAKRKCDEHLAEQRAKPKSEATDG